MPEYEPNQQENATPEGSPEETREQAFYRENMKRIIAATPKATKKNEHIANVLQQAAGAFEDVAKAYGEFLQRIRTGTLRTDGELAESAARELQQFRMQHFSIEEFETRLRAYAVEQNKDFTPLTENNLLYYDKEGQEVRIHVGLAHAMPVGEKARSFREGIQELVQQLRTRADLQDVQTISATSWIVTQHPKLLERIGFTIEPSSTKTSSPKKHRRASVTKEELLEHYPEDPAEQPPI